MIEDRKNETPARLTFGIYPGSGVGVDPGSGIILGKPGEFSQIVAALDSLCPPERPFLVRGYLHYTGAGGRNHLTPSRLEQYVKQGRKIDLALCYRPAKADLMDWADFIRAILREYGPYLAKIQITEEPNNPHTATGGDGSSPNVIQAIFTGVLAAKEEISRLGYAIQVGFNATPSFDPEDIFWNQIGRSSSPDFVAALDYVGLDFYPDVFRPLPPGLSLSDAVTAVLTHFRMKNLANGKIPATVPIHITENGWPTSATRTPERQAVVVEEVIRTIAGAAPIINITHYEFFNLRDADSADPGFQFGLMRDNYSPKPAFSIYRKLIEKFSS